MTAFEAYTKYLAYRMHFTNEKYDILKYNGKVKADSKSFETRNDRYMFHKLSKVKDLDNFLISNLLEDSKLWVGSLFDDKCKKVYLEYLKRRQALTYTFKNDLQKLDSNFDFNFKPVEGQYPPLLKLYRHGEVSIETLIILDDILGYIKLWDQKIMDPILWPSVRLKMQKYKPFVSYDRKKILEIIRSQYI